MILINREKNIILQQENRRQESQVVILCCSKNYLWDNIPLAFRARCLCMILNGTYRLISLSNNDLYTVFVIFIING